ncbi:MAG: calcium/sodium antiporter [Acidimicrobiaceae bacterium]|nr:calcium/sodium antiporter [Acidimicrobiaceae bacterium]MDE0607229.1 calcium/sodium antiporter [Acidimicrobiaceae bacterium]
MIIGLVYAVGGLLVLAAASDQFVKGAVRLAVVMRIAPVIVGSVIVGFGTSAPEMVVSGIAAAEGNLDIGVGNVIGSNVANISLVLGCATLMAAVPVKPSILRREVPISVASVVVFAALIQGDITRLEGIVLLLLLLGALAFILRSSPRHPAGTPQSLPSERSAAAPTEPAGPETSADAELGALPGELGELVGDAAPSGTTESIRTIVGLALVAGSAWFVVEGAERIADELDLTGGFIGFTLVAIGTSAPELFTAVAAARRGEIELLIGNLLGSNMFNSFAVGGVIALAGPGRVLESNLSVGGSTMMVAIVVVSALMMITKLKVSRAEGIVLLAMWVGSVVVLATI